MTDIELNRIYQMDALEFARSIPAGTVQTVVTSPPYFGLRDYGVDGQWGSEKTPEVYIDRMVELFAAIRVALRDDGCIWVNMGDGYWTQKGQSGKADPETQSDRFMRGASITPGTSQVGGSGITAPKDAPHDIYKPKDLMMMPARVALALQADGWYLRSDIIWHKPNPMPESVTDRPTKSHEYIFLLSKSANYYYDADAIRVPCTPGTKNRLMSGPVKAFGTPGYKNTVVRNDSNMNPRTKADIELGANKRSVWTVATQPFSEAHFATFPEKLITPCILAGAPAKACAECGAGWVRVVEVESIVEQKRGIMPSQFRAGTPQQSRVFSKRETIGFEPTCDCDAGTVGGLIYDPFMGSGTTALVARKHGRQFIGSELNAEYVEMANKRLAIPHQVDMFSANGL